MNPRWIYDLWGPNSEGNRLSITQIQTVTSEERIWLCELNLRKMFLMLQIREPCLELSLSDKYVSQILGCVSEISVRHKRTSNELNRCTYTQRMAVTFILKGMCTHIVKTLSSKNGVKLGLNNIKCDLSLEIFDPSFLGNVSQFLYSSPTSMPLMNIFGAYDTKTTR